MRRRGKVALGAVGLVLAVAVAGIPVLVVPASNDPAEVDADVAFVIGPPTDARMEVAYDLIDAGRADALMVSLDPAEAADWPLAAQACTVAELRAASDGFTDLRWLEMAEPGDTGDTAEVAHMAATSDTGDTGDTAEPNDPNDPNDPNEPTDPTDPADRVGADAGTTILCAKPDPFTTRGEARWLEDEMAEHGWDSAAVITLTPHISRARMIMERCDTGDVAMVDVGEPLDPWFWVYMYGYQAAGFAKAAVLQGC